MKEAIKKLWWGLPPKDLPYKGGGRFVYNWFSNFEPIPVLIDGILYPSVENYYQAQKTTDAKQQLQFLTCTPSKAKYLGRKITMRKDWNDVKFNIMRKALQAKFGLGTPQLEKLLQTEGDIVEWNNWGDQIWGATLDGYGTNWLGELLMEIRDKYKK